MDKPVLTVGKSFYTECKKCATERYHMVLSMTNPETAKIKCEVCGSQKTWKYKDPKKVVTRKPAAAKVNKSQQAHQNDYEEYSTKFASAQAKNYSVYEIFKKDEKLQHAKFGMGFIVKDYPEKIEVLFADEMKSLLHRRPK